MMFVLNQNSNIANHYLADIRDVKKQANRVVFRNSMERLGAILAYELSKTLSYSPKKIITPLGVAEENLLIDQPVLITILRAGIPFYMGVLSVFEEANSGFIGAFRAPHEKGQDIAIEMDYMAVPPIHDKVVILIDPMLASGNSIVRTIENLQKYGNPKHVHIVSAIAALDGLNNLKKNILIPYSVWTGAVDDKLNDLAYIVPGLGDAGDLSFGEKL